MSAPYPPGQPQWRPERPPPIQFRQEEPPPPASNKGLQWTLRIAGLVAVAVISGLVWHYVTSETTSAPTETAGEQTPKRSTGVYQFTEHDAVPEPRKDKNCAEHAYDDIQRFLQEHPCVWMARGLYQTEVHDGRTVYTSVAVVRMPDEESAAQLRQLADTDETGNVNDLVREGLVSIEGLKSLAKGGGYKSTQSRNDVVIVESDFDPKGKKGDKGADEKILDAVCEDALRLGPEIDSKAGSG